MDCNTEYKILLTCCNLHYVSRPSESPEAIKIALYGGRHLRSPQNQNLSKMRGVLKYGIFDISSMST